MTMTDNKPTGNEPPEAITMRIAVGVNKKRWQELSEQGYTDSQIEEMFTKDVEYALARGAFNNMNKLALHYIQGEVLKYY
jgi:hypothetical protein